MYVHEVTPSKCNYIYCIAKPTMECLNNHDETPKLETSMKSTYDNALVGCNIQTHDGHQVCCFTFMFQVINLTMMIPNDLCFSP